MSRKRNKKKGVRFFLIAGLLALVIYPHIPRDNPAPILPVPQIKPDTVTLPGALTLEHIETNVLGAETIDPLDFIGAINNEREKVGSPLLRISPILMKAAKMRADVILKYQNFSHLDPYEGLDLASVLPKVNYHFVYASENIGMGGTSGPDFTNGFMNSTSHRQNLLDPKFTDTGAAVVTGPYKEYYVNIAVQLFAIPGGEDETLGYTKEDISTYEKQLSYLNNQLIPIRWVVEKLLVGPSYTDDRRNKLERQRDILTAIYERMSKKESLTAEDALLVQEYNRISEEIGQS